MDFPVTVTKGRFPAEPVWTALQCAVAAHACVVITSQAYCYY